MSRSQPAKHSALATFAAFAALASASLVVVPACDKAGTKPAGALQQGELELLKHLPAETSLVMGGNYMKLQQLFSGSAFTKLTRQFTDAVSKGLGSWMDCFMAIGGLQHVAGVSVSPEGAAIRQVLRGVTIKALAGCADKAGFKQSLDADGKFISVEMPGPAGTTPQGFLQLADGAVYSRQAFGLGGSMGALKGASRAELEADQAAAAKQSAVGATKLQAVIAKADRSKTSWFAGHGAGTPIADKVGELHGSLDLERGLGIVVNAELLDQGLGQQLEEGVKQAKQSAAMLPPMIKGAVERLELTRDGARIRVVASLTEAELGMIGEQIGKMAGMAGAASAP